MKVRTEKLNKEDRVVYKGKSRIWTGCIVAALVAAIAVFAAMMQMEKNLLARYEKGKILVTLCEIPKGQVIDSENGSRYLAEKEIDVNLISDTALTSMEQLQSLSAGYDIEKGTLVTKGMFEEISEVTKEMKEPVIAGFKAEDMYQVVGGVLRAGDRIHIYSVCEKETAAENEAGDSQTGEIRPETELIWENVFVQAVFDQAGISITGDNSTASAQRINVFLDKKDVAAFYSQLASGSLRAVKVCE